MKEKGRYYTSIYSTSMFTLHSRNYMLLCKYWLLFLGLLFRIGLLLRSCLSFIMPNTGASCPSCPPYVHCWHWDRVQRVPQGHAYQRGEEEGPESNFSAYSGLSWAGQCIGCVVGGCGLVVRRLYLDCCISSIVYVCLMTHVRSGVYIPLSRFQACNKIHTVPSGIVWLLLHGR